MKLGLKKITCRKNDKGFDLWSTTNALFFLVVSIVKWRSFPLIWHGIMGFHFEMCCIVYKKKKKTVYECLAALWPSVKMNPLFNLLSVQLY